MIDVILVGVLGVLFGFAVAGVVSGDSTRPQQDHGPMCYECRSRVAGEFVETDPSGYPVCPVCGGNMLPPVGSGGVA